MNFDLLGLAQKTPLKISKIKRFLHILSRSFCKSFCKRLFTYRSNLRCIRWSQPNYDHHHLKRFDRRKMYKFFLESLFPHHMLRSKMTNLANPRILSLNNNFNYQQELFKAGRQFILIIGLSDFDCLSNDLWKNDSSQHDLEICHSNDKYGRYCLDDLPLKR